MANPRYMWLSRRPHKDGRPGDVYPSSAYRRKTRRAARTTAARISDAWDLKALAARLKRLARNG